MTVSLSYGVEKSEATHMLSSTDDVEQEVTKIAAAYTTGGLTLSLGLVDYENVTYTADKDVKATVLNIVVLHSNNLELNLKKPARNSRLFFYLSHNRKTI